MPDDIVTQLDRGRPVTDTELLRRADWIRLQTIDLIRQAGLGHYSSTFSCASTAVPAATSPTRGTWRVGRRSADAPEPGS